MGVRIQRLCPWKCDGLGSSWFLFYLASSLSLRAVLADRFACCVALSRQIVLLLADRSRTGVSVTIIAVSSLSGNRVLCNEPRVGCDLASALFDPGH